MALFNADRKEVFEVGTTVSSSGYFRVNDKYGEKLYLAYIYRRRRRLFH